MKTLLLAILVVMGLGCGRPSTMPNDFIPYYREFINMVGAGKEVAINLQFGPIDPILNAVCAIRTGSRTITVNADRWAGLDEPQRKILIFHELTHCTFNSMGHSADPLSYMNAYLQSSVVADKMDLEGQARAYTGALTQR